MATDPNDKIQNKVLKLAAEDTNLADELKRYRGLDESALQSQIEGFETSSAKDAEPVENTLETIVLRVGRPVIAINNGSVQLDALNGESQFWRNRLNSVKNVLSGVIGSVGRISIENHALYDWVGTGWFVDHNIVVTSRHIAETFARSYQGGYVFREGINGSSLRVSIDMLQEANNEKEAVFHILQVLHIEPEPGPNVAFLRVAPSGEKTPPPVELDTSIVSLRTDVAVIGYPFKDTRIPDLPLVEKIYGNVFDKKRLAPGQVTRVSNEQIFHDCSTLGSFTGGLLVNLATGKAIGLQSQGRFLESSVAISAVVIAECLRKARPGIDSFSSVVEEAAAETISGDLSESPHVKPKNPVSFYSLQQGVKNANQFVTLVRNRKTKTGISTGWLITDRIVVIPNHSINIGEEISSQTELRCHFESDNEIIGINARLVHFNKHGINTSIYEVEPALLRLARRVSSTPARLNMNSLEDIDEFYMLHFPGAKNPLRFSVSRLVRKDDRILEYKVDSQTGSGGAPLLSFDGSIFGMHYGSNQNVQLGLTLRAIISYLQKTAYWKEIAKFHSLPMPVEKKEKSTPKKETQNDKKKEDMFLRYAVRWNINPTSLKAGEKEILRPLVIDSSNRSRWVLEDDERIQIIQNAKTLQKLRTARGKTKIKGPDQEVIDTILKGPPYSIDKISDETLPYWLQAVNWFQRLIPNLPSRKSIHSELQRRKLRSRLMRSTGPDFRGRMTELAKLRRWYLDKNYTSMIISGIGGIGKSALVSKFALDIGDDHVMFWLDFDRPDLAPDNAVSVLKILAEQLSVQAKDYAAPVITKDNWQTIADDLGESLKKSSSVDHPALIILDGFEVAQYSKRYNEIWTLLERILQKAPDVKVIVSGRSAVANLTLNNKKSDSLPLTGLEEDTARQWLQKHKIRSEAVIKQTFQISRGIPLILKLAARFMDEGGKIDELPRKLPQVMVEGFLYQRIYNRVINPKLKGIVRDILVLRLISPAIIKEVLFDSLPSKMDSEEVFQSVLRELSLVPEVQMISVENAVDASPVTMVNIRSEVRAASLRLLEYENKKRVQQIDQRIIKYYKKIKRPKEAERVELIYHYLRLGKVESAKKLWKPNYLIALENNVEDIPEKYAEARKWLENKISGDVQRMEKEDWEYDAFDRISNLIVRGHINSIAGILKEKKARVPGSRLVVYDALVLYLANKPEQAIRKLSTDSSIAAMRSDAYYQRQIFAAMIAYRMGKYGRATDLLEKLNTASRGFAKTLREKVIIVSTTSQLLFSASTSLKIEIDLLKYALFRTIIEKPIKFSVDQYLPAIDIILPELQSRVYELVGKKVLKTPAISPVRGSVKDKSFMPLSDLRAIKLLKKNTVNQLGKPSFDLKGFNKRIDLLVKKTTVYRNDKQILYLTAELAKLSWERWHLAILNSLFKTIEPALRNAGDIANSLMLASGVAMFRGTPIVIALSQNGGGLTTSIDKYVTAVLNAFSRNYSSAPIYMNKNSIRLMVRYLEIITQKSKTILPFRKAIEKLLYEKKPVLYCNDLLKIENEAVRTVAYLILMPHPLEILTSEFLGFTSIFSNELYFTQKDSYE